MQALERGCWVRGDREQLKQLCLNLLVNAKEAVSANGEVHVRCNDDGTWTMTAASAGGAPATWQATGSITSRSQSFVLEGDFISSNPGDRLGPALCYLSPWRNNQALGGNAGARYKGLHITTGITLEKVQ